MGTPPPWSWLVALVHYSSLRAFAAGVVSPCASVAPGATSPFLHQLVVLTSHSTARTEICVAWVGNRGGPPTRWDPTLPSLAYVLSC